MPDIREREQLGYTWRFGAGSNTRASEDEIRDEEDGGGVNFALDLDNTHWQPRKGFVKVATTPNAASIQGFAQLHKNDGTLSTLIQSGDTVYEWDLANVFTDVPGPDLVTNGAMAADTDWTKGTGWTIAAGVASCDGTQVADSDLTQSISAVSGKTYSVTFTVSNYVAGNVTPVVGDTEGTDRAANGTFTETITSGAGTDIDIRADLDFVGDIDDVTANRTTTNVNSTAKLRGPLSANWGLDEKVLISDLSLIEDVKEWNGTTFKDLTTTGLTNFKAKYLFVENERAWAANVAENAIDLPHVIAASKRGDETVWTVTDRPTSALGAADPFQLTTPDLRPVNGLVYAFGTVAYSTRNGSMYRLLGTSAKDFFILPLFSNSAATGDEAVVFVGNDVFYGRQGVIESLSSVESLADVSADDLSRPIYTDKTRFNVKDVSEWKITYDRQRGLLYCFPDSDDRVYVFNKAIWDDVVQQVRRRADVGTRSPWGMWETQHPATFQPVTVWEMLDANKRYQVYFGDSNGNIYQFQNNNFDGDSTNIKSERLSRSIQTPRGASWDYEGHVIYRASTQERILKLRLEHGGISISNQDIFITLPAIPLGPVYGGTAHYGGTDYYGTKFVGRLARQPFTAAGRSSRAQIRATIEGQVDFSIAEIKLSFKTGSQP